MTVEIEKQNYLFQLESCELQTDTFLLTKVIGMLFRKTLIVGKYIHFYESSH